MVTETDGHIHKIAASVAIGPQVSQYNSLATSAASNVCVLYTLMNGTAIVDLMVLELDVAPGDTYVNHLKARHVEILQVATLADDHEVCDAVAAPQVQVYEVRSTLGQKCPQHAVRHSGTCVM